MTQLIRIKLGDDVEQAHMRNRQMVSKWVYEKGISENVIEKVKENKFVDKYMPDHPAADENGYVQMPNVNTLIEMMDMREAQRSYEANLGMVEQSRDMMLRTIDVLR